MDDLARLLDRYLPHLDGLAGAWEADGVDDGDGAALALFDLLAPALRRRIFAGEHAAMPALFAELERSLVAADPAEADAAARLVDDLLDGAPELLVHVLPWLGPRALAGLRARHRGALDPFLAPDDAAAHVAALAAACPAMARAWSRAAQHVSARDGTTSAYGLADLAFEVARTLLAAGDDAGLRGLLAAVDGRLDPEGRATARAFERSFLERLRELPLAEVDPLAAHLGPRARAYWRARLRLGEPRFGVWDERPRSVGGGRLVPARATERGDAWGWKVCLPRGDAGSPLRERLLRGGEVVGEDQAEVGDDGGASSRWTWSDDDPASAYALEIALGARVLARLEFTLR